MSAFLVFKLFLFFALCVELTPGVEGAASCECKCNDGVCECLCENLDIRIIQNTTITSRISFKPRPSTDGILISRYYNFNGLGEWRQWVYCPSGTHAISFSLKIRNGNDPCILSRYLNGVRMRCATISGSSSTTIEQALSQGTWHASQECSGGFLTGLNVRIGGFYPIITATDFLFICDNFTHGRKILFDGTGHTSGNYAQHDSVCGPFRAVCGFRPRFDLGFSCLRLLNIQVLCCPIVHPLLSNPAYSEGWIDIATCDSNAGAITCNYDYAEGIEINSNADRGAWNTFTLLENMGLRRDESYLLLFLNLSDKYNAFTYVIWADQRQYFRQATKKHFSTNIPAGHRYKIRQVYARVSIFTIKVPVFRCDEI